MNKNIKLAILVMFTIISVIVIIHLMLNIFLKMSYEGYKNNTNKLCDNKGCPKGKLQNDMYKLHLENKRIRDNNHMLSHNTQSGNLFSETKGPANIFIIRHGEKIKSKFALDCNGILRSTFIPDLIEDLNKKNFGIHSIITTYDYNSMHQQQTVMITSWLFSIPLFIYGDSTECQIAIQTVFTNPYFNGKTVLFCWEHTCIQELLQNIISIGVKRKGLNNYVFKNPEGTNELPYWDTNNYKSIIYFDEELNFNVMEEELSTCYKEDNNVLVYGKKQKCKG